jgi:hypothetical protein
VIRLFITRGCRNYPDKHFLSALKGDELANLLCSTNGFWDLSFKSTKSVKNFSCSVTVQLKVGSPMRVSDSSMGGEASQFHTMRWAAAVVSADGPSQSVPLALCDAPIAAEGRPRP